MPERPVALLLGTVRTLSSGRVNAYYRARIDAAAALHRAGRVGRILCSGDGRPEAGDEPAAMRDDLIAAGVPADRITLDPAGFRTLDSVVRAREVFGLERVVVVSQRFHAQRAIYLARAHGIDAVALAAADVEGVWGVKVRTREVLARTKAWLDVNVLAARPRELGESHGVEPGR